MCVCVCVCVCVNESMSGYVFNPDWYEGYLHVSDISWLFDKVQVFAFYHFLSVVYWDGKINELFSSC